MRISALFPSLCLVGVVTGCDAPPSGADPQSTPPPAGKADAFDSTGFVKPLAIGDSAQGHLAQGAIQLFAVDVAENGTLALSVDSEGATAHAFLYDDLRALGRGNAFIPPAPGMFDAQSDHLDNGWELDAGSYILLVTTPQGVGEFDLTLSCAAGDCDASSPATSFEQWAERAVGGGESQWSEISTTLELREGTNPDVVLVVLDEAVEMFEDSGFDASGHDDLLDAIADNARFVDILDGGVVVGVAMSTTVEVRPSHCFNSGCGLNFPTTFTAEAYLDAVDLEVVESRFD